jgi:hypothetical protein
VRQILLLHSNTINAERFDELAAMLERRGYEFVTLERALGDPAYAVPDEYAGPEGISWLQRWALKRGLDPESLVGEAVAPRFVHARSGADVESRLNRWWTRVQAARRSLA